jgi:hypothetical protein
MRQKGDEKKMEQSAELRERTLDFYRAMETADTSFIETFFSQEEEVLNLGSDPEEWLVGHAKAVGVLVAQLKAMQGISIGGADPQAFSEGSVGWVADQFKLIMPSGTTIPFRMTLVYHKEAGEWKAVQLHLSIGVPNEQAIGYALPTG